MIHLDANYLILGNQEGSLEDAALRGWLEADRTLATSTIAWLEFVSGPVSAPAVEAELATRNVADFRLFVPHGLVLVI